MLTSVDLTGLSADPLLPSQ